MKKTALSLSLVALCTSYTVQADTLLGLYAGAQAWNMDTSGGFSSDGTNVNFDFEDQTNSNIYVAFEHPIPLIPNIKVQRSDMSTQGDTTLDSNFTFGGELFQINSNAVTDIDITSTDFILYYELFDNDLVSFDLGINTKYIDGELLVVSDSETAKEEFSGPVPMLYSRVAVGLPFTGLGAFVEGSFLNVDDHTFTDYQAAITYNFVENLAIDVTFQVGYRAVTLELEDLDDIYSDIEFKGAYAGLELHF